MSRGGGRGLGRITGELDEPLLQSINLDEIEARKLYRLEKLSVKAYAVLLVIFSIFDLFAVCFFASSIHDGIQWVNFDVRKEFNDFLILNLLRVILLTVSCIYCLIIESKEKSINFYAFIYWVLFSYVTYGIGKIIALNWSDSSWQSYVILIQWMLFSFGEIQFVNRLIFWLLECTRWKCDETNDIDLPSSGMFNKVKQSVITTESSGFDRNFLKVLKPYFWPRGITHKLRCLLTWVFLGISRASNLFAPIFIGRAVQELSKKEDIDINNIYLNIILYGGSVLSTKVFKELQNMVYLKVKQRAYVEIAEQTFTHLHSLSFQWHVQKKMGNVLRSMDRGVEAANSVVNWLILWLMPSIIECIIVFVIFYTHFSIPTLSSVAFMSFIAYSTLTIQVTIWRKKYRTLTVKHDNDFHDKATDSLINYETVKYFTAESFEVDRYINSVAKYQSFSTTTSYSLSFLNISQSTVIQICTILCLCIAGNEVRLGNIQVGEFVSVSAYINNMFAPLGFLGSVYNAVIQAVVDMGNLTSLLKEEPDIVDTPNATELIPVPSNTKGASIEFRNVGFSYPAQEDDVGLTDLSFQVKPGTTTAICGHTGAGKSTIARLLFRFYDPKDGQILISSQNIRTVTQKSLRQSIGVVPQDTVLFNDTILHNIQYGRQSASMEEIIEACKSAQILDFIYSLPEKFETMVGERGLRLSGGEKQRVSIARCLLKNPPIVLLDEATSALDSVTERSVQSALNGLSQKRTTVVIAHRLSTIQDAEQIIVLGQGKILEKGTHSQLLSKEGAYYELWSSRLEEQRTG